MMWSFFSGVSRKYDGVPCPMSVLMRPQSLDWEGGIRALAPLPRCLIVSEAKGRELLLQSYEKKNNCLKYLKMVVENFFED